MLHLPDQLSLRSPLPNLQNLCHEKLPHHNSLCIGEAKEGASEPDEQPKVMAGGSLAPFDILEGVPQHLYKSWILEL